MAEQQENICTQIVAMKELLLQKLILLCGERPRQGVRGARNILALQQVRQLCDLVYPSQFIEDSSQSEESADAGGRGQGRGLYAQARHPSEDVGVAAQLRETGNLRVFRAEIDEEVAHHDVVVARAGRSECGAQRLDGACEGRRQRMLEWRAAPAHHDESLG